MIIEIFQSPKNKNYFFRIKARNGRIIAQSEGYKRKTSALNAFKGKSLGPHRLIELKLKDLTK